MNNKLTHVAIIFVCLCLLSASNSWNTINHGHSYSYKQATDYKRALHGHQEALAGLVERAYEKRDEYWLNQAAQLGNSSAFYKLATITTDENVRREWLQKAASAGEAAAQFEWSLLQTKQSRQHKYLLQSAEQDYLPAQHALANWFLLNQNETAAIPWLEKTATHYADDAFALANILWRNEQQQEAIDWYQIASENGHTRALNYHSIASGKKPISLLNLDQHSIEFEYNLATRDSNCAKQILPLSLSLANQVQAEDFVKRLTTDERLQTLPICISKPVWIDTNSGFCDIRSIAGRNRASCDLTKLSQLIALNNVTHVVIFLPDGRAYVNAGVMYLDILASYSVFVHELAHFSGFADEYPISNQLAEYQCAAQTAPNLLFDGELTYSPQPRLAKWQEYAVYQASQPLTLYAARTCNNIGKKAYKMTAERTFMEFHDTDNIPLSYRVLWRDQLINKNHWYPVAINLARFYEANNQVSESRQWRLLAEQQRALGMPLERPQGIAITE